MAPLPRELLDLARQVYRQISEDRGEFHIDDIEAELTARLGDGTTFTPEQVERAVATVDAVECRERQTPEQQRAEYDEKLKPYWKGDVTKVQAIAAYLKDHPDEVLTDCAEWIELRLREEPGLTWEEAAVELQSRKKS
jgi:hypothetical protein